MSEKACFWYRNMPVITLRKTYGNHRQVSRLGKTYFTERGFTDQTIDYFDLGYALAEKDAFQQQLLPMVTHSNF